MIKIHKYKDSPNNRKRKEQCMHCQEDVPIAEMTSIMIYSDMYSDVTDFKWESNGRGRVNKHKVRFYMCTECYGILYEKTMLSNVMSIQDNIELEYNLIKVTAEFKEKKEQHYSVCKNYDLLVDAHAKLREGHNKLIDEHIELRIKYRKVKGQSI